MKRLPRLTRKTKAVLFFVLLALLAGSSILFVINANSSSQGTITTPTAPPDTNTKSRLPVSAHGKTAAFQYPNSLHQTKADTLSSGDVEKFSFVKLQIPPWDLTIQIRKLPSGVLADDGSYNLRKTHPEQYHEQKLTINNQSIVIMSDLSGGYSKVAFLVHGGLAAEVALTSSSVDTGSLDSALNTVLDSWHWI